MDSAGKQRSVRERPSHMRTMRVIIAAIATLLPVAASPREACPAGGDQMLSPRSKQQNVWHQASVSAELLSPSPASTGSVRRRAVLPPPPENFIDTDVLGKMKQDGIVPTGKSTDAEFLRRVTLDLTGQI